MYRIRRHALRKTKKKKVLSAEIIITKTRGFSPNSTVLNSISTTRETIVNSFGLISATSYYEV